MQILFIFETEVDGVIFMEDDGYLCFLGSDCYLGIILIG